MRIIDPADYRCHPWRGSSPWGQVQRAAEIAPGLHQVSTAGHGGVWLSSSRVAALTKAFPGFVPFAGWPWLEEDCDACLAVLAWPELFPAAAVREAVRMVHVMADWKHCANKWGAVRDQIRPDVIDIADAEEKRLIDADASLTTTRKGNDMRRMTPNQLMDRIVACIQARIVGTREWLPLADCPTAVRDSIAQEVYEMEHDAGTQEIDGQVWEYRA